MDPAIASPRTARPSAVAAPALVGLVALASAMGVGRFAFTPMLPLMQQAGLLDLAQGGWLAAANYLGYLAGALACLRLRAAPGRAARRGLAAVAVSTLAMGVTESFAAWVVWRFVAGAASAWVLVGVSAWALPLLARAGRPAGAGAVYAGVGAGICCAGLLGLAAGIVRLPPQLAWLALGAVAALAAALVWRPLGARSGETAPPVAAGVAAPAPAPAAPAWRLVACYGVFGFGYIIPATFLPAAARELFADPALFGWTWPVFGLAAAVSTLAAARVAGRADPRRTWALAQLTMALGVAAPALLSGGGALLASAIAVGGTFMVVTMAGMQLARSVGRTAAPKLTAAMTAAFAAGQLLGPLTVGAAAASGGALRGPSLVAAALLAAGTLLLRAPGARVPASTSREILP